MRWFALTHRSDASDAVFRRTGSTMFFPANFERLSVFQVLADDHEFGITDRQRVRALLSGG